jgi:SpoVK/Ycf46/Vps4 family AAA+-type ATPase
MDADILKDLKHLDERVEKVDQFLRKCTSLFDTFYSEADPKTRGVFAWPYSIQVEGEDITPDWPNYGEPPTKLSPSTNALCGWAVSRLRGLGDDKERKERQFNVTSAVEKLAALPTSRLQSETWKEVGEIFLHAQVLRFLASQNVSRGDFFEYVYDQVSKIINQSKEKGKELGGHPFFLHYCVLAWEQVRVPAIKVAERVIELCDLAKGIAKLPVPGKGPLVNAISLFEYASRLHESLESFATVVASVPSAPETLKIFATRTKVAIGKVTRAITQGRYSLIGATLKLVKQISIESINQAGLVLESLPSKVTNLTTEEKRQGWAFEPTNSNNLVPIVADRLSKRVWYGEPFQNRLTTEVVQQVSYAASGNESRLDIGALAYSLAAAVRSDAIQLATPLARKALSIIFDYQRGGRWNQVQPMSRTAVGFIHVPLNIEIANALLSVLLKDLDIATQTLQQINREAAPAELRESWSQIDQIMRWVEDTINRVGQYAGWCNEHDFAPDRIDLWVTAQVAQFLLDYREILKTLVIRSALERAGLTTKSPDSVETSWEDLKPIDAEKPFEEQVKNKLREQFVLPTERGESRRATSVLLYGPPGTSKTSMLEAVANRLHWRFLQITPADFLSTGGEQVEARATLLFEILRRAKKLVVLFDEVDEFLLDRETKDRPGGIFRFMTTSMLPKLQALKSAGAIIFGIATNYQERLDKAITRQGRVDRDWAIFPPDFTSRILLIGGKFKPEITDSDARAFAATTPFFSYPELKVTVKDLNPTDDPATVVRHPTASPDSYANRPGSDLEFLALLKSQISCKLTPEILRTLKIQVGELKKKAKDKSKVNEILFSPKTLKDIANLMSNPP